MTRTLRIVLVAGLLLVAAVVLNPSPERHRQRISDAIAERSELAALLGIGRLTSFVSNYHSLGVASYTTVGDRVVSIGLLGFVYVRNSD